MARLPSEGIEARAEELFDLEGRRADALNPFPIEMSSLKVNQ